MRRFELHRTRETYRSLGDMALSSKNDETPNETADRRMVLNRRLQLLRAGRLSRQEVRDFAADAGKENFIEAEPDLNQLLDHSDAIVRYNAIATVAYEWGRTRRIQRICEILRADPDRDCRRQAASALGVLARGTHDREIYFALAGVATNPAEFMDVRAFAFVSALDVVGVSKAALPNPVDLRVGQNELLALEEHAKGLR